MDIVKFSLREKYFSKEKYVPCRYGILKRFLHGGTEAELNNFDFDFDYQFSIILILFGASQLIFMIILYRF